MRQHPNHKMKNG